MILRNAELIGILALALCLKGFIYSAEIPGTQYGYLGYGAKEASLGYTGIAGMDSIDGNSFNPAGLAELRRIANSVVIGGLGGPNSLFSLGLAIPSAWGVFSINFLYTGSSITNDLTSLWGFQADFAKPILDNLFWGAGIKAYSASMLYNNGNSIGSDWQLDFDLGLIYRDKSGQTGFGFLEPSYGLVLKNIGKNITINGYDSFPAMGIGAGVSFYPVKFDPYKLRLCGDLTVPFNPLNAFLNFGIENIFFDFLKIRAGYILSPTNQGLSGIGPFTFGVGFTGKLQLKAATDFDFSYGLQNQNFNGRSELVHSINISIAWGYYDDLPPEISITPDVFYFSPNTGSGQDNVHFALSIKDNVMVAGWQMNIIDKDKKVIRSFKNLKNFWPGKIDLQKAAGRIFSREEQVDIPKEIVWYGKNDQGIRMADGEYYYELYAWDENGNTNRTRPEKIVIDTVVPGLSIAPSYLVFSPNGDGVKDDITFSVKAANCEAVDRIHAGITNAKGISVRDFDFTNGRVPEKIIWDGKDDSGKAVAEGSYSFYMIISNPAGNFSAKNIPGIRLVTNYQTVAVTMDYTDFSPDGNGNKDVLKLKPKVSDLTGLEKWSLKFYDAGSNMVREFTGKDKLPEEIVWGGRNQENRHLPDGLYYCILSLGYDSGNHPESPHYTVKIDTMPPVISVKPEYMAFSPNGDGKQDTISFYHTVKGEAGDMLEIKISDQEGKVVYRRSFLLRDFPDKFIWNGLGPDSKPLPEGKYTYEVLGTDTAGNNSSVVIKDIVLKTGFEKISLQSDVPAISPLNPSAHNTAVFTPAGSKEYISSFEMDITDGSQSVVRSYVLSRFTNQIRWDGKDNMGKLLPDGTYSYQLKIKYTYGNESVSLPKTILLENTGPEISLSADNAVFSPVNGGRNQTLSIHQSIKSDPNTVYEAAFLNADGKPEKTYRWAGSIPDSITWDGLNNQGVLVPEGLYSYRLKCTDMADNKAIKTLPNLKLLRTLEKLFFTCDLTAFSPNAESNSNSVTFTPKLSSTNDLLSSVFTVYDSAGKTIKQIIRQGTADPKIAWDGKDGSGNFVSDGYYSAELKCSYLSGNVVSSFISNILFCRNSPDYKLSVSPDYFTPDEYNENNVLDINLQVDSLADLEYWKLSIYQKLPDGRGPLFKTFNGKGNVRRLIEWDGRSDDGKELVGSAQNYTLELDAKDKLGNSLTHITKNISVGVILEKDPLGVKMTLPEIRFEPGKAILLFDSYKALDGVILSIRKILSDPQKYGIAPDYTIEVNVFTDSPDMSDADNLILSRSRARQLNDYLIQEDLDPKKLKWTGYGNTRPYKLVTSGLSREEADEYRRMNERVEFFIRN